MGFRDDVGRIAQAPDVRRLAERRAGSRELAEDALHETFRAVAQTGSPEKIRDLQAFFCASLIREINHQRGRPAAILTDDIETISNRYQDRRSPTTGPPPTPVDEQAALHILVHAALAQLEAASDDLVYSIPARSEDARRYRAVIVGTAITVVRLLLEGYVDQADWNAILKTNYPQWCDEPGLARPTMDQRLSRARRDVQSLLRSLLPRDQLAS